jgi:selenocysteine-specific elongation factor
MPKPDLAGRLGIDPRLLEGMAAHGSGIVDDGATLRSAGHGADLDPEARASWEAARAALAAAGPAPPRIDDLGLDPELLHALVRRGEVIEVSEDYVCLPETVAQITEIARNLGDGFTVADFRDAAGITRRHAVPLLEWMDGTGITRREGDRRRIRSSPTDGPASGAAPSR